MRRLCFDLLSSGSRFSSVYPINNYTRMGIRSLQTTLARNELAPPKPVITIPVPVEKRALKRHRNIKNLAKQMDKEKLKNKPLVIACRRQELNHRMGQTYGKMDTVPLASQGWYHRKSHDDYFTINSFQPNKAENFTKETEDKPRFNQLNIDPNLVDVLNTCGYHHLTNIQTESLPSILDDKDAHALLAAETGNGKTLCFLIPILQKIIALKGSHSIEVNNRASLSPLAVVVAPSQELAQQIADVARHLAEQLGIKVELFIGGSKNRMNADEKKHCHMDLVVGSFGTVHKLFKTGYLNRKFVTEIALDEIDTLVDDTFKDGLMQLLKLFGRSGLGLLTGVRLLMTGATFPTNFDNYMSEIIEMEEVHRFSTDKIHKVLYHLPQKFIRVASGRKLDNLKEILEKTAARKTKKTLIFCNKASTADFLNYHLRENNFSCINFNQNVHPSERMQHYRQFAFGDTNLMIATDLASRGLDTTMVHHVINYDFPLNAADYIHRVGRVGRVGSCGGGHVTSLVDHPIGIEVLQRIEMAARKDSEIRAVNNNIIRIIQHNAKKKDEREY